MSIKKKKIGVLTSGGDAPGMNAAIRSVVRSALYHDMKVTGILRGYEGLLSADIMELTPRSVSDTIHRGGTILLTARCQEMMTEKGQKKAAEICKVLGLDALVVIGGDGSLNGALKLSKLGVNVIGIPATIDLDLPCSEYAIGFDTAVNTAMESINRIRDTSSSHERISVVEVMGRNAGYIALWCAMTGGAEEVLIPEVEKEIVSVESVVSRILENRAKGKTHNLVVVAEGIGGSMQLAKELERITGIESRATILGYLQRGGTPTALDRMHASLMGYHAVKSILNEDFNKVMIVRDGKHIALDLEEALSCEHSYDPELYDIMKILSV